MGEGKKERELLIKKHLAQGKLVRFQNTEDQLKARDLVAACKQLPRWNKARIDDHLRELLGLTIRRSAVSRLPQTQPESSAARVTGTPLRIARLPSRRTSMMRPPTR